MEKEAMESGAGRTAREIGACKKCERDTQKAVMGQEGTKVEGSIWGQRTDGILSCNKLLLCR